MKGGQRLWALLLCRFHRQLAVVRGRRCRRKQRGLRQSRAVGLSEVERIHAYRTGITGEQANHGATSSRKQGDAALRYKRHGQYRRPSTSEVG